MRILFVALPDSIHAARWINQVTGRGWDVHLFPAYEAPPHAELRELTVYGFSSARPSGLHESVRLRGLWPFASAHHRVKTLAGRLAPRFAERSGWLARLVRRLKPDVIHSMEFQRAGYLTLDAKRRFAGRFPAWIATNWGSDVYLFGRLAEHRERVRGVLAECDFYHSECERDVRLAREHGFKGEALPVLPGGGGFDLEEMRRFRQPGPTSARRVVALKGYQNWAGRALFGLRALELCADALRGYTVAVHLAEPDTAIAAELFAQRTGLPVEILPPGRPHEEILRLHGRARVSVGLSISDAASTSALEAMVMGSFPVQSETSCLCEWARDGETALLVQPEDPEGVAAAVRRALADDALVDRAAELNARTVAERLDRAVVEPRVVEMYERVVSSQ
ncbi:MAG TPA: glycosyltransferase [Pyrinomonadaceae bacterium]|nr:glycosyltransferase [Pyrinomonadaceae bacterium]